MSYYEERRKKIEEAAQAAAKIDGYKVMKNPERNYFYIITPSDNVLYIQNGDFSGLNASLEYIPSRNTGSGCRCNDEPFYTIDAATLKELERDGMKFARRLNAHFYTGSAAWLAKYWEADKLETL
jgi:hypothetical protein